MGGAYFANLGYDDEMITSLDLPPDQRAFGFPDLDFWRMAARLNLVRLHGATDRLAVVGAAR